jgi:6-phosphogluconolactonase
MNAQTSVWADAEALSRAAAEEVAKRAAVAVENHGRFDLVLAGGHTPRRLYEILAADYRQRVDWSKTHLFWGDERYVAPNDPSSNFRMARESLIEPLGLSPENAHAMPTALADPDAAARAYEETLRAHFGAQSPAFDLILLGIGPEGHTASLFPGSSALDEKKRWVLSVRAPAVPPVRLTLTLVALNAALDVFFLVAGPDKRSIVGKLRGLKPGETNDFPAARIAPRGETVLFLDRAAAG